MDATYTEAELDYLEDESLYEPEASEERTDMSEMAPVTAPLTEEGLTVVNTANELQQAVLKGARDIEIRSHLDLTVLNATTSQAPVASLHPLSEKNTHLMYIKAQTRSIRGNCGNTSLAAGMISTDLLTLPPPLPLKPLQCLLLAGESMMQFLSGQQWLDNIYLRVQRTRVNPGFTLFELGWGAPRSIAERKLEVPTARVYMTNVTVQGERRGQSHVLVARRGSQMLAEECIFADLYGGSNPFHLMFESSAHFSRSTFQNIHVTAGIVELASGGIAKFDRTTFRDVHATNDTWVTASTDDTWVFQQINATVSLEGGAARDLERVPLPSAPDRDAAGEEYVESEAFFVEDDFLFDEAYGQFDYSVSQSETGTFLPEEPVLLTNDTWFVETARMLPARAPHLLAGPPTQLPFPPRKSSVWPNFSRARKSDREAALLAAGSGVGGGASTERHMLLAALLSAAALLLIVAVVVGTLRRHWGASRRGKGSGSDPGLTEVGGKVALMPRVPVLDTLHESTEWSAADTGSPRTSRRFRLTLGSAPWGRTRGRNAADARPIPATHAESTFSTADGSEPLSTGSRSLFLPMPRRPGLLDISTQHMWEFSWAGHTTHTTRGAPHADTEGPPGGSPGAFTDQLRAQQRGPASAPATSQFPLQHWTSSEDGVRGTPRARAHAWPGDTTTCMYVPEYSTITSAGAGTRAPPPLMPAAAVTGDGSTAASAPLPVRTGAPGGAVSPPPWALRDRTITTFHRHDARTAGATSDHRIALHLSVSDAGGRSDGHSAPSVNVMLTETTGAGSSNPRVGDEVRDLSDQLPCTSSSVTSVKSAPPAVAGAYPGSQEGPESASGAPLRAQADSLQTIAAVFPCTDPALTAPSRSRGPAAGPSASSQGPAVAVAGKDLAGANDETSDSLICLDEAGEPGRQGAEAQHSTAAAAEMVADGSAAHLRGSCRSGGGATALPWLRWQLSRRGGGPPPSGAAAAAADAAAAAATGNSSVQAQFPSWQALQLQRRSEERAIHRELQRIERLLNSIGEGAIVFEKFRVLGRKDRRRGGQAIIQFATLIEDGSACAMKFFVDRCAFHTEVALYAACGHTSSPSRPSHNGAAATHSPPRDSDTGKFLPRVEAIVLPSDPEVEGMAAVAGPQSSAKHSLRLPPCIVMEKGESLHDWSERGQPDFFMALSVLSNVASRLADMHAAGYVHRDLKPSNVMWLPRENRWTVIDFGCAARVGESAPLCFTLTYAAPEVMHAYEAMGARQGGAHCEVACSADMWALGVMAFELLTGRPAFQLLTDGRQHVVSQLLGEQPLPWEGQMSDAVRDCLGGFKGPILRLLHRDPRQRDTAAQFYAACRHVTSATR